MAGDCPCVCTLERIRTVPFASHADGSVTLRFSGPPGLYQLSVTADARDFDWDSLYITFDCYGNEGKRTGPWDFNELDENKPLVPSYWVALGGRRLGLWFFQRVHLEDMKNRCFRGRVAFYKEEAGETELSLTPYREWPVRWATARLEPDPEDRFEPLPFPVETAFAACPARAWAEETYWARLRQSLASTHALYAEPLKRAFDWAGQKEKANPNDIQMLLAAWRLDGRPEARDKALRILDETVALPHWGNPKEDGYSHDGDMAAAIALRSLAWALHAFREEMDEAARARLLDKLALQGRRFLDQALLNRDYWGGSVLQDHGWRSLFGFGAAALSLLGLLPAAETWARYALPRIRRALEAMPRDGVIPPSSYSSPYLYLDELMHYRECLLAAGGEDLLDRPAFRPIVDYLLAVVHEAEGVRVVTEPSGYDVMPFFGGNAFLIRMASKFRDRRAARLATLAPRASMETFYHTSQETAYYMGALWGFLSHDPQVPPAQTLPRPARLTFFEDGGLAHYRDEENDAVLSVQCGPWCGYNAYRRAQGPCDRMSIVPGAGHFLVALGTKPLLLTPDSGYRLHTALRSCLLVDGRGQCGDVGYPMSIPSKTHEGEELQYARWDEAAGEGRIRLHLAPAYPEDLGVDQYTREFLLSRRRRIVCRDHVVLRTPRRLSWLFQGKREIGVAVEEGLVARFGSQPHLRLRPESTGVELTAAVQQTDVVWGYCSGSGFQPFDHVRYDTASPLTVATIDFVITW